MTQPPPGPDRQGRPPEPPSGWFPPSPEDLRFCGSFSCGFVRDVSRPQEALPTGYPAYTAVLHRLRDQERSRWLTGVKLDTWQQIQSIEDEANRDHTWVTDVALEFDLDTARAMGEALQIAPAAGRYVASGFTGIFAGRFEHELTGPAFAEWYADLGAGGSQFSAAGRLSIWFPSDRSWVANAPYDMGITYIASDQATADRVLAHPDLEALPCRHWGSV